jgi:hypothetical protein
MPVIPVTQEADISRISIQGQPSLKKKKKERKEKQDLSQKYPIQKGLVEWLTWAPALQARLQVQPQYHQKEKHDRKMQSIHELALPPDFHLLNHQTTRGREN